MSYLIYYLQFILLFVIHDLIYHLSSKMFLISLFHARLFVYNSKKIFLSYCSIKLVKNVRYNGCFKALARFTYDITSTKEEKISTLGEMKEYRESLQADGRQIRKVSRANHRGWISDSTIKMTKSWKFLLLLPVAHSRDSFRIRCRPF